MELLNKGYYLSRNQKQGKVPGKRGTLRKTLGQTKGEVKNEERSEEGHRSYRPASYL